MNGAELLEIKIPAENPGPDVESWGSELRLKISRRTPETCEDC